MDKAAPGSKEAPEPLLPYKQGMGHTELRVHTESDPRVTFGHDLVHGD